MVGIESNRKSVDRCDEHLINYMAGRLDEINFASALIIVNDNGASSETIEIIKDIYKMSDLSII